jgi:histidyl-tRNA synthetase
MRGLDYYTRTAFEVVAPGLGAQDAVAGGGRYNGLSQQLGGPALPGLGFAIGEDRLLEVLPRDPVGRDREFKVFLAALGAAARDRAFALLQELRRHGIAAEMDLEGRSLKAQMSLADRLGADCVVIIGERELADDKAQVRDMAAARQQSIAFAGLVDHLKIVKERRANA